MKQCSLFCATWWPFLLLPLLLLLPLIYFNWDHIEKDVAANAQSVINHDLPWAEIETYNRGRDVLLTGTAPDQQGLEIALQRVASAEGVRTVNYVGELAEPLVPAFVDVEFGENNVVLKGVVDSNTTLESLLSGAAAVYGSSHIVNQLSIAQNATSLPQLGDLFSILQKLPAGSGFSVNNEALTIRGEVVSDETINGISTALAGQFAGEIKNQLTIDAEAAENLKCQQLLNNLLAAGNINFESSKATITADSHALLDRIAKTAARCTKAKFEVAGHTDSVGNAAFNMALSQQRAQAVIKHLKNLDLDTKNFSANGYGSDQPIASNDTLVGRATNRRIEFKIKR